MANHCVEVKCFACGHSYCTRGCNYDWCTQSGCGKHEEDPEQKKREKEALEKYYRENPMPDGWF